MRTFVLTATSLAFLSVSAGAAYAQRCRDMPEARCLSCCKRDGGYSPDQCANFCRGRGAGGVKRSDIILRPEDALALLQR